MKFFGVPDQPEDVHAIDVAINHHLGRDEEGDVPFKAYTSCVSFAWELFEEMRKSGRFCCLKIDSDYHYVYGITLIEDSRHRDCVDHEAASQHQASFCLEVPDVCFPLLISAAYLWVNRIIVDGVQMPWEENFEEHLERVEEDV